LRKRGREGERKTRSRSSLITSQKPRQESRLTRPFRPPLPPGSLPSAIVRVAKQREPQQKMELIRTALQDRRFSSKSRWRRSSKQVGIDSDRPGRDGGEGGTCGRVRVRRGVAARVEIVPYQGSPRGGEGGGEDVRRINRLSRVFIRKFISFRAHMCHHLNTVAGSR